MRVLVLFAALCVATGCSDDETEAGGCYDYSTVDLQACGGPCSLVNDVMPIFQLSCNLSNACHTNRIANPAGEGLQLGPPTEDPITKMPIVPTQMEIDEVHGTIVNGDSVRSTLPLVAPSDPASSWLMAKLEYTNIKDWTKGAPRCEAVFTACDSTAKGCGVSMPQISPQLEPDRLAKIRAWIADGAQNN